MERMTNGAYTFPQLIKLKMKKTKQFFFSIEPVSTNVLSTCFVSNDYIKVKEPLIGIAFVECFKIGCAQHEPYQYWNQLSQQPQNATE